jgi:8-oxo-dGTP pyrophosphatase MutT (NUDIX family)
MALPGGRKESQDKDLLETARRETAEETGVKLPSSSLAGMLKDLRPRNRSIPKLTLRPYVFALRSKPQVRPGAEVAQALWVPLSRLRGSRCRIHVPERRLPVDAFLVGPRIVWGITYRILENFIAKQAR